MKKSQLVSAIKNVLAENKKQKLDENTIREIIREVLSEKQNINEEAHDFIRDIESALGKNPSPERVEQYLGRALSDEEREALGGGSGPVIGYQYGRPIYANQKKKVTNWKYSGGGYGRKRYE
jgi:hypothetical protein